MEDRYIGTFRGFKVDAVPDDAWAGHIAIPESMVKYIQDLEEIKRKYYDEIYYHLMDKLERRSKNE